MSEIVELKNINSFRFVEKALLIEEERLKAEHPNWPEKKGKVTRGYDSKKNITYTQRTKEEAADYRYFPEPDLPPFNTAEFDLEQLRAEIKESETEKIEKYEKLGLIKAQALILISNPLKTRLFEAISEHSQNKLLTAKFVIHYNYKYGDSDIELANEYAKAVDALADEKISKNTFAQITLKIHEEQISFEKAFSKFSGESEKLDLDEIISKIITENPAEVKTYRAGKKQLIGFFVGQVMKETGGRANPQIVHKILIEKLE